MNEPIKLDNSGRPSLLEFIQSVIKEKHSKHSLEFDHTPADFICSDGKRYEILEFVDIFSKQHWGDVRASCTLPKTV